MNMPRVTIGIGGALVVLGVVSYYGTGGVSVTALIPAFFGLVLIVLGGLGFREPLRRHTMHAASVVGLLGLLGSASAVPAMLRLMAAGEALPAPVLGRGLMALLTGVYVILCIKSFLDARRRRAAGQA